ncbi:iron-containing alcohol dehydrogenase [Mycetocola miduiensis]|uniref:Alcohol dehydrogenase n=1 Tax=Mycetocola miduiensis TaxID=995034 RepID=A0A1I5AHJ6_9MICO|nr:iron-containing alcohol dehydrogenase [Mycetocola miduiensis]SFN61852.1 alcohol dehydrogenase [Mycetocola miduiensis]
MPTTVTATADTDLPPASDFLAILRAPHEVLFGAGQRLALPWVAARYGSRAIVFADPFLTSSPEFTAALAGLEDVGIATHVYSEILPELPTHTLDAAVEAARRADAEMIIAIGGGSSIDLAKVVAVLMAHGGPIQRYYGEFKVPGPGLPVIAVPTTAGTGSEVTPVAVLTDPDKESKVGISSPYLIPTVAICDPELTLSCPPVVTLASGVDALSHCIESYTAVRRASTGGLAGERVFVGKSALTDELAITGIRSIVDGLERALTHPQDVEARAAVMYGALLGGLAFGTAGTAAAHALQYPVGAVTHTPHGIGVGVLLPAVMTYNAPARPAEMAAIARVFGAEGSQEACAASAPHLVAGYLARIGIPASLAEIGFPLDRLNWAAGQGLAAVRLSENNPVPLTLDGALRILTSAHSGYTASEGQDNA